MSSSSDSDIIDFFINERINETRNNTALFMSILVSLTIIYFAIYSFAAYRKKTTFTVLISILMIVCVVNLIISCMAYSSSKSDADEETIMILMQSASYLNAIQIISIFALSIFIFSTKTRMKRCSSKFNTQMNQTTYVPSCIFVAVNLIAIPYIILRLTSYKNNSDFTQVIQIPAVYFKK